MKVAGAIRNMSPIKEFHYIWPEMKESKKQKTKTWVQETNVYLRNKSYLGLLHQYLSIPDKILASSIVELIFANIVKILLPRSIVTDRDKIFIGSFWQNLFRNLITSQYNLPSINQDQTERVNQCVENYLYCMVIKRP